MLYANGLSAMMWAISIFLGSSLMALASETPCTLHHEGNYYNLNSLKASQDYEFKTPGGHSFYLNVCRRFPNNVDIAGLVRKDHHDFAVGLVNTTLEMRDTGLMLHLSNGSPCPGEDNLYGSSSIRFLCDASVYGAGGVIYLSTRGVAIDVSSRQTGGDIPISGRRQSSLPIYGRVANTFCLSHRREGPYLRINCVLGDLVRHVDKNIYLLMTDTLYNRFVLKKRGFDQLARLSKPHLVELMDFCMELFRSVLDNVRSSGNRWARLTRDLNPASHQWSSRDEEQAMMAADPLEDGHDQELQDTNVRRNDAMDDLGPIRS
ncbi:uncharacterized protein EDB93DRAFT_1152848 [Suillus bovinus]|uniref:uncharacterized protein n=1 Tax=Suillus bovinus TaxID=48563 RepID=UPI001B8651AB|nr:uncharacterized protein EDB93DRAFT_1152848 [Suillus bovinus]KAG2144708.1 hypothetical protein EDB93DRAFT_1152848 [Suillus bovinus]